MQIKAKSLAMVLLLFIFTLAIVSVPRFVDLVMTAGNRLIYIQSANEYLIAIAWAFFLGSTVFFYPVSWNIKKHLVVLWFIRTFVTLFVMLIYERHYSLDAYEYYRNIMRLGDYGVDEWGTGTDFIVNLGIFLDNYLPFGKSYHAFKVLWSYFGFLSILPLYKLYKKFVSSEESILVLWMLGAFPSLVFWTSILGKDPIALLGISAFAYGLLSVHKKISAEGILYLVIGALLLAFVRYWLVPIFLIPAAMSFMWQRNARLIWRTIGFAVIASSAYYLILHMQNVLVITTETEALKSLNQITSAWATGGSALEAPSFNSLADVISFLPKGMLTALFRPLPGEVNNLFGIMAGIESLAILILFAISIKKMRWDLLSHPVIAYSWFSMFVWSSFYCFISYQNMGTAVRFRTQILPFIILLPFIIDKVKESIDSSRNISIGK